MISRTLFLLTLFFTTAFFAVPAWSAANDSDVSGLYNSVLSPYCPGITLSACTSNDARLLREEISGWMNSGLTAEQVRDRLVSQYGAEILGLPATRGARMIAWFVPPIIVVVGLVALIWFLRRSVRPSATTPSDSPLVSDDEMGKVDREIRNRLV